jgi:Tol biopolymer transport system component
VTALDPESSEVYHRSPWFLPDGRHFLYSVVNSDPEKSAVYVGDIEQKPDPKDRRLIVAADSNAVYAPPGYLLFVRETTLMAEPFDTGRNAVTGDVAPIAERIDTYSGASLAEFSVSQNGVLAYTAGAGSGGNVQPTWFDRSGKPGGGVTLPGGIVSPAISPDGSKVAFDRLDPQTALYDIWLRDLARGTDSRFTFGPRFNRFPVWSPDGTHLAFTLSRSARGTEDQVHQRATSGTAQDEVLDKDGGRKADDWSRDGRYLIEESDGHAKTKIDIWVLPLFGDRKPFPYLQTEFNEHHAKLSPNGRWLAYVSDESKRNEVYVVTFPKSPSGSGGKWQVSTNGGNRPVWSRDGKELYFIGADGKMMAVGVRGDGASFDAGVPQPLFDARLAGDWYDVGKDGRFLIPIAANQSTAPVPITVVVNWTAGLKK